MADRTDIRRRVNRGIAWVGVASSTVGLLDILAYGIVLALWIPPERFGVAMLAVPLFPMLDLATDLGLTAAAIQRDDHSDEKTSTVFWLNLMMSLILFGALALGIGPLLSWVYDEPILTGLLTVYGFKLVWQNVYFMPGALMQRELRFKEISVIRICANVAEFAGKVGFAAAGFGIWCFVAGPLCRVAVTGVGIQLRHPWRPKLMFHLREALDWTVFGFKHSAHKILFHLYTNVDYLVVGYFFGNTANGFYGIAYKIVLEPALVISEVITKIAFPAFSRLKHSRDQLIEQLASFTRLNLVVMLSFLGLIFVAAEDIISVFWGARGLPAATAARILCAVGLLRALSFMIPPLLDGMGRPGLTLVYTIVAALVLPAGFVLSAVFLGGSLGFYSVALAWAVGYPVAFFVLAYLALELLEIRALEFLRRVWGIAACAAVAITGGALVAHFGDTLRSPIRFGLVSAVLFALFFLLLARFEGITPRAVVRALRDG